MLASLANSPERLEPSAGEFSTAMSAVLIMLVGVGKGGVDQRRFYQRLLTVADERYDDHLGSLGQPSKESNNGKKTR